ncbi:MAG: L,D-transpeptidase family protein [Gammaproteobacteria bacterium]|nr:L,D-transpeptidase family protein [Gammaproteobacteria bacterium]MDH3406986.1 L,D-transpeptidase family protein [Gammaproteobacteria bacterium]MDH3563171.1 L,D-transpeptidase family protein [Gammaproteobacteria bacterium]MDH5487639.1 L,D-transpeptidase family protein [Gammaproteobacteria bacterium]
MLLYAPVSFAQVTVDLVRVVKSERKLMLLSGGEVVREFKVVLGGNPRGHKLYEGDKRTPEGSYTLDYKKNDSVFYKAIHISYPNPDDLAAAKARGVRPGGQIMIHGQKMDSGRLAFLSDLIDWTNGCIALKNEEMDELWEQITEGTKIEILP